MPLPQPAASFDGRGCRKFRLLRLPFASTFSRCLSLPRPALKSSCSIRSRNAWMRSPYIAAPRNTILKPLYSGGLWLPVTTTHELTLRPSSGSCVAKYATGVGTWPRLNTSTPAARMPLVSAPASSGPDRRPSRATATASPPRARASLPNARPMRCAVSASSVRPTMPRMSSALKMEEEIMLQLFFERISNAATPSTTPAETAAAKAVIKCFHLPKFVFFYFREVLHECRNHLLRRCPGDFDRRPANRSVASRSFRRQFAQPREIPGHMPAIHHDCRRSGAHRQHGRYPQSEP